jgi:UDP-N-acetylglucosamine acyltransferase
MPIHASAHVDPKAHVPASAEVGPNVVIEGPVRLGEGVRIYPNAFISGWTEIGDRVEIHPGAVVGHLPQDFHFSGERSYCRVGSGTIIREFASIHRGTQPESATVVGEDCFILGYAHVGHNCELGRGVKVYNCAALSGHVVVGAHAIVSGYSLVHQFLRIGEYALIGGGSRVAKDVPPYMKAVYEAQIMGPNTLGLRRSEAFTPDEIQEVRRAYRILFRTGAPFRKAVEELRGAVRERTGRRILEFIDAPSKLGVAGGRKLGTKDAEAGDTECD